jgi:hypothetical protein
MPQFTLTTGRRAEMTDALLSACAEDLGRHAGSDADGDGVGCES